MAKLVSKTYGDALFEVGKESNRLDVFYTQVTEIVKVLNENKEIMTLMDQPKIAKSEKVDIIKNIFSESVEKEIIGLMKLLIEKGHGTELEKVFAYFIEVVKEEQGIGVVFVTSAVELSETQKIAVEKRLLELTDYKEFEMNYIQDSSLIGGMIIRIKDRVVDTSIKTKLYQLSKELKNIQIAV